MGKGRWMRFRSVIDRWFASIVVGCLLIAAVGAVAAHGAYVDPGTHQEQRSVDEWRASGSFSHGATVAGPAEGTPFEAGATVRNRTVYFQRIMPVLSGNLTFRTPGADAPVNLTVDRRLVVESASGGGLDEEPTVYWRDERRLGANRTTKPADEPAVVPVAVSSPLASVSVAVSVVPPSVPAHPARPAIPPAPATRRNVRRFITG